MPCVLKAALFGALILPMFGAFGAQAADLDEPYVPERPYEYAHPVVVERPFVVARPVVVERPIVVERRVAIYPQPYFYPRLRLYPRTYFDARRVPPPVCGAYRRFACGPRPDGWSR